MLFDFNKSTCELCASPFAFTALHLNSFVCVCVCKRAMAASTTHVRWSTQAFYLRLASRYDSPRRGAANIFPAGKRQLPLGGQCARIATSSTPRIHFIPTCINTKLCLKSSNVCFDYKRILLICLCLCVHCEVCAKREKSSRETRW